MNQHTDLYFNAAELREKAEKMLASKVESITKEEIDEKRWVHELQVHQIELEMQNEALVKACHVTENALDRYSKLFNFAPIAYFVVSQEGLIQETNFSGETLLGIPRSQISGQRFINSISVNYRSDFIQFLQQVFSSSHSQSCNLSLLSADRYKWVNIAAIADMDQQTCLMAVTDNTQEHLVTEQSLRFSETRWHLALDQLSDAESLTHSIMDSLGSSIAVLNDKGDIIHTNDAWRKFAVENGGESLMKGNFPLNYFEVLRNANDLPEASSILAGMQAVLNGGQSLYSIEYPCDTPKLKRWFRLEVLPLKGSIKGLATHHIDITERKEMEENLRRQERLLADSQAINHIGSWLLDIKSGRLNWSEECFRLYDLSPEFQAILNVEHFLAAVHPEDRAMMQAWCEDCLAGKNPPGQEFRTCEINGAVRWLFGRGQLETTAKGEPMRMLGTVEDITQRKIIADALRDSEARLRAFLDNSATVAWMKDAEGRHVYISPTYERRFSVQLDELKGKTDFEIWSREIAEQFQANDRLVLEKNQLIEIIETAKNPDGSASWWLSSKFPFQDSQGNRFVGGMGVDITERKLAEIRLQQSEFRYRTLFENSLEAIFVNRGCKQILAINPACLNLWRAKQCEELLCKQPLELFHPDYRPIINEQLNQSKASQTVQSFMAKKILRLDGSIADVLVSIIPFREETDDLQFVVLMDITEQKQAEAALLESKTKYQDLSNHLESVREEERIRIAREIHDDLGNFLAVLKVDLSWLNKQLPANLPKCREKSQEMLQQINECIQAVRKLITDLRPSILDHLGLFPAIEWKVEDFRRHTDIHCLLTLPERPLVLDTSQATAIFRILQEALTNILSHANATRITVAVELGQNNLLMTITDNGCGISPADKDKSVGFGLQGMQERARYFGGFLNISSQPGSGTTISLSLPLSG